MREVTMLYSEYKKLYSDHKTVYGSYDRTNKTIIVKLPDDVEYTPTPKQDTTRWVEITINPNNVSWFENSVLIKMPHKSDYNKWEMWVSRKLVKIRGGMNVLLVKENFSFQLKRKGYNPKNIGVEELAEAFNCKLSEQEYPELHVPETLEPIEPNVLEDLKDD